MDNIFKGNKFYCIETVKMDWTNNVAYVEGKTYISERDHCITDEMGHDNHMWVPNSEMFAKHFVKVEDSTDDYNYELVRSYSELKPGDKVWRIVNGEWEIIEFLCPHPHHEQYAFFMNLCQEVMKKKYEPEFITECWLRYSDEDSCWLAIYKAKINRLKKMVVSAEQDYADLFEKVKKKNVVVSEINEIVNDRK